MAVPTDADLVDWAVQLARAAGERALQSFAAGPGKVDHKPDGSLVTAADRAIESFLREEIAAAFPDDGILGEEGGGSPGSSGRRWILDPIDGTEAFVHGVGEFSTLIALEDADGIVLGIVEAPVMGETLWASRDGGGFLNGSPIRMSDTSTPEGAFVATSDLEDWPDEAVADAWAAGLCLRTWGGGYGIGLAVSGRVDAFIDFDVDMWDVAPAAVLAAECGGLCTDLDGVNRLDGGVCLVAPPGLHAGLLDVMGGRWQ
jgi:histidinol phosphatase-like enzyme (inositol monophosphatase family)